MFSAAQAEIRNPWERRIAPLSEVGFLSLGEAQQVVGLVAILEMLNKMERRSSHLYAENSGSPIEVSFLTSALAANAPSTRSSMCIYAGYLINAPGGRCNERDYMVGCRGDKSKLKCVPILYGSADGEPNFCTSRGQGATKRCNEQFEEEAQRRFLEKRGNGKKLADLLDSYRRITKVLGEAASDSDVKLKKQLQEQLEETTRDLQIYHQVFRDMGVELGEVASYADRIRAYCHKPAQHNKGDCLDLMFLFRDLKEISSKNVAGDLQPLCKVEINGASFTISGVPKDHRYAKLDQAKGFSNFKGLQIRPKNPLGFSKDQRADNHKYTAGFRGPNKQVTAVELENGEAWESNVAGPLDVSIGVNGAISSKIQGAIQLSNEAQGSVDCTFVTKNTIKYDGSDIDSADVCASSASGNSTPEQALRQLGTVANSGDNRVELFCEGKNPEPVCDTDNDKVTLGDIKENGKRRLLGLFPSKKKGLDYQSQQDKLKLFGLIDSGADSANGPDDFGKIDLTDSNAVENYFRKNPRARAHIFGFVVRPKDE